MKISDQTFKKIFVGMMTLSLVLGVVLILNLILHVPLTSKPLWVGSAIMFIGTNIVYDLRNIAAKLIVLAFVTFSMSVFFVNMLQWSPVPSLYVSLVAISLVIILYMTFAS